MLLAGAVGKRQGIAIPYPSPTPLLTPGGIRCGGAYLLPRAYRDIGSLYPVQVAYRHFDVTFGCFVFGLKAFAFQKITPGICLSFFIGGGMYCSFLRLRWVLLWSIVGITADRDISSNFVECKPISPIASGARILKNAFVRLKLQEIRYSIPVSTQTNDPIAVSANPTKDHSKTYT